MNRKVQASLGKQNHLKQEANPIKKQKDSEWQNRPSQEIYTAIAINLCHIWTVYWTVMITHTGTMQEYMSQFKKYQIPRK